MFEIKPRETVILVSEFDKMVEWYKNILGFKVIKIFNQDFHYCNMKTDTGIKLGIGVLDEMGLESKPESSSSVILQIEVDDLRGFFEYLKENQVTITGGPSFDKRDKFWFGSFNDPEGNSIWVVDSSCP